MAVNNLNTPGVGIQPSIVDAKGDLIAGTAADAVGRLAVGTNGQVLVADSGETTGLKWNNPGTVGGLVHINTTSFSAVSSVSIPNNTFTSTFKNYKLVVKIDNGSSSDITLRFRTSGTDNSTSNYGFQRLTVDSTAQSSDRGSAATAILFATSNPASENVISIDLYNPFATNFTIINSTIHLLADATTQVYRLVFGNFRATTSFDSCSFLASSGNIAGSIQVYGYKE